MSKFTVLVTITDENGKAICDALVNKEYTTKANASKLVKRLAGAKVGEAEVAEISEE